MEVKSDSKDCLVRTLSPDEPSESSETIVVDWLTDDEEDEDDEELHETVVSRLQAKMAAKI